MTRRIHLSRMNLVFSRQKWNHTILAVTVSKGKKDGVALIDASTGKIIKGESGPVAISARRMKLNVHPFSMPEFWGWCLPMIHWGSEKGLAWKKMLSGGEKEDEAQTEILTYCPDMHMVVSVNSEKDGTTILSLYETSNDYVTWNERMFEGDTMLVSNNMNDGSSKGLPTFAHLVKCNTSSMTVVITARGGIAVGMRVDTNGSGLAVEKQEVESSASGTDEL